MSSPSSPIEVATRTLYVPALNFLIVCEFTKHDQRNARKPEKTAHLDLVLLRLALDALRGRLPDEGGRLDERPLLVQAVDDLVHDRAVVAEDHHARLDGLAGVGVDLARAALKVRRAHLAEGAHLGVPNVPGPTAQLVRLVEDGAELGRRR